VRAGAVEQHGLHRGAALQSARDHHAHVPVVQRSRVGRPQRERQSR
jgi:hypothetical protein